MKLQILSIIISSLLVLVRADNNCSFTVDQLNGQILKPIQQKDCDSCFTSNVKMTISSNAQQITKIRLEAVDGSGLTPYVDLTPGTKSLTIDPNFMIAYQSGVGFESLNFLNSCQTQTVNGKLTYDLTFTAKVRSNFQSFELNNGYTSSLLLKNISFVSLVLSIILLF